MTLALFVVAAVVLLALRVRAANRKVDAALRLVRRIEEATRPEPSTWRPCDRPRSDWKDRCKR